MKGFLAALGFLTVVPVPAGAREAAALTQAAPWFPVVGTLLGTVLFAASRGLERVLPPPVIGAVLTAVWAGLTGFLHLDGTADSFDALLAPGTRERRLEILKDARVGAFGAAGLTLFLILKAACLSSLAARSASCLLLAPAAARWLALAVATMPPARPEGMGRELAGRLSILALAAGAIVPAGLVALGGLRAVLALAAAALCAASIAAGARKRLGGVNGDILGLSIESTELVVLLVHCAEVRP
ncbi:MAG: adenosylcobinamide-GDP ribazoletransferase [Planctomycetes bacterium]|nr:adenosylcobinamide-GDP ribazoletransferase [Planctomycetota bacterium]